MFWKNFQKSKSVREIQKTPGYGSFKIIPTIDGKKRKFKSNYMYICIGRPRDKRRLRNDWFFQREFMFLRLNRSFA